MKYYPTPISMSKLEIIPIKSYKILEVGDDLVAILFKSLKQENLSLEENDILVVASKIISVVEDRIVHYSSIESTKLAKKIAKTAKIDPEFAQVILNESDANYIGFVPGAITTLNQYGLLANAGSDQSNVGDEQVILLPQNCKVSAKKIHEQLKEKTGKYIGIVVADSRTMPMRLGTVGGALATFGFRSIIDERGNQDLFGRPMHITTRAIADQLATAAEILMGETDERIPFVIIRGYPFDKISKNEEVDINSLITAESCMFIGPLLPCLREQFAGDIQDD